MRITGLILGILAGLICFAAGIYLALGRSEAAALAETYDATVFDHIAHGAGIYFVGKAFAIWSLTAYGFSRSAPLCPLSQPAPPSQWR